MASEEIAEADMDTIAELYDKKLIEDINTNTKKYQKKIFVQQILRPYSQYLKPTTYSEQFTRTLAHYVFTQDLSQIELSGVSGIGKTCTTLHFVLDWIFSKSANDVDIAYVDVNEVRYCFEDGGLSNERLNTFFNGLYRPYSVIIDHVTSRDEKVLTEIEGERNVHLVNYIISQVKARQTIFIYTGYTAGIFQSNIGAWSNQFALSEEEFTSIWNGRLKFIENMHNYSKYYNEKCLIHTREKCQSVYRGLQDFALTPELVHYSFDVIIGDLNKDVSNVRIAYLNKLKKDVDNFPSIDGDNEEDIADLVKEASLIADIIKNKGILPLEFFESRRCPVNIFTYEIGKATREDCESNVAFLMHEMSEGEEYVKLSFIQQRPSLIEWWMKKLTLLPKHISQLSSETLQKHIKSLGMHIGRSLIESQLEQKLFFIPHGYSPTSYIKTAKNCEINSGHLQVMHMLTEKVRVTEEELEDISVDEKYKGQMRNVALYTKYLINQIVQSKSEAKLMYNFLGADYFLYIPSKYLWSNAGKKRKYNNLLTLFKVIFGKSCGAKTIAATLDCISEIIVTELHGNNDSFTIDVHVCFFILHNDPVTLKDCIEFVNTSCIGIANPGSLTMMTDDCRILLEAVREKITK